MTTYKASDRDNIDTEVARRALDDWANGKWTNPVTHCATDNLDWVPEDFCGVVLKCPAYGADEEPALYRATFGTLVRTA